MSNQENTGRPYARSQSTVQYIRVWYLDHDGRAIEPGEVEAAELLIEAAFHIGQRAEGIGDRGSGI